MKACTLFLICFKPDFTFGLFNNSFAHRQSEPCSGSLGGEVGGEYFILHFFGDSRTIVFHYNGN